MARSRPKLSQSPWSGLDAVRKIMDRFGEFGESLNRMAGALHGLEDSMKHLLGVTSRVTAAMLMLHGSLAYAGKPKQEFKSTNDKDKPDEKNWEQIIKAGDDRRKKRDEEEKEKVRRLKIERDFNNKLYKLNAEKDRLSRLANKYEDMAQTSKTYFMGKNRQEFIKERKKFISIYESKKVNAKALDDNSEAKQSFEDTKTKQTKAEKAAATKSGGVPKGPADTTIKKWVLDTEYGFASLEKDSEKAVKEHDQLDKKDQQQKRIVTQISLIGVNELGQIIKSFSQNIEPVLNSGETLYNLGNKTDQEHKDWVAQQKKVKNKVSLDDAAVNLASFSATEKVHESIHNPDLDAPKLVGKNALSADIAALTNSINKVVGNVLFDKDLPTQNTNEATLDPVTANAKDIKRLLAGLNTDELKKISTSFGLNEAKLLELAQTPDKGLKQTDLVSLFGQTYTGAGAHDAESDTKAYAKLDPIIQKFVQILKASIDTRSRDEALDQANLGQNAELDLARQSEVEFEAEPLAIEKNQVVSAVAARIKDIDLEASEIALAQNNGTPTTTTGSPKGSKAHLSSFSMNPDKSWKEQPHLLVDGQDVLSPTSNPKATPEDYIAKLKELKASNATSTMGRSTDFNEAIDAFSNASKITPLDPNMDYAGFSPAPFNPLGANPKGTPNPHVSRVQVSPFETTGTGSFTTKPKMDIDRLPAMTGTYADDTAYTEDMVSKLDELIAADATNMQGNANDLKSIRDILKNVLDEFKNYKVLNSFQTSTGPITPIPQGVPISSTPTKLGPNLPTPPTYTLPKSLRDIGTQLHNLFKKATSAIESSIKSKLGGIDFTKVMGGGMENAKEAFSTLAKGIFVTATALSGAVMGLSQLASPDVFATFQNSLVLLGMAVGSAFMVPMLKLSWYIQQVAKDFLDMSPAVRKNLETLATFSMYVVGASLALKALAFIVSPIAMVAKGLWALTVAIGATIAAMGKNGIVNTIGTGVAGLMGSDAVINTGKFALVVGRVVGVVGLVTAAFLELRDQIWGTRDSLSRRFTDSIEASHNKKVEDVIDRSNVKAGNQEESEKADKNYVENKLRAESVLGESKETSDLFAKQIKEKSYGVEVGGPGTTSEVLDKTSHPLHDLMKYEAVQANVHSDEKLQAIKEYSRYEQMYHKDKEAGNEKGAEINLGRMATILSDVYKIAETRSEERKQSTKASLMYKDAPPSEYINQLKEFGIGQGQIKGGFNEKKVTKRTAAETKKDAQDSFDKGGGMKGLLMSLQSFRSQPSFMGVEEAHRRIQVEALKSDPLEQLLNEVRSNELFKMVRSLAELEKTSGKPQESSILQFSKWVLGAGH